MAYVYLADRSTCPTKGQVCDWQRPPRLAADVMPVVRAFYRVNTTGQPIPQLKGTLDLIFAREPRPPGQLALPFEIFDGKKLVPIPEYLAQHPRPDLLQLDKRMQWLGAGPYGDRAGDIVLLARSGLERPIEERFYFSKPGCKERTQENVRLDNGGLVRHDIFSCENGYFDLRLICQQKGIDTPASTLSRRRGAMRWPKTSHDVYPKGY